MKDFGIKRKASVLMIVSGLLLVTLAIPQSPVRLIFSIITMIFMAVPVIRRTKKMAGRVALAVIVLASIIAGLIVPDALFAGVKVLLLTACVVLSILTGICLHKANKVDLSLNE